MPRFIAGALSDEPLPIYGDGMQSRDFTYVGNVVDANLRAANAPDVGGMVFNVATGTPASVNDLADMIGSVLDRQVVKDYLPSRAGDVRDSWADIGAARRILGWEPTTDLTEGLRLTAERLIEERGRTPTPTGP